MSLPKPLIQAAKRHDLVLLIGMDLPKEVTNLETSKAIADSMGAENSSLVNVFAGISQVWKRNSFVKAHFTVDQPGTIYKAIAKLPIWYFMTTCYDDSLKLALIDNGRSPLQLTIDSDLDTIGVSNTRPQLIKLCGNLETPNTLVRTKDEFIKMPDQQRRQLYTQKVANWLATKTVLLIGCDPAEKHDFLQWQYRRLLARQGGFGKQSYLVWPAPTQADQSHWSDTNKHVEFIDADPSKFLTQLANALSAANIAPPTTDLEATKRLLQILAGTPKKQEVETAVQAIETKQPINLIRATMFLRLSRNDTLLAELAVTYDPDIDDHTESERDTGITLIELESWANKAAKRRRRSEDPKGTDVEELGREFFEKLFPAASPTRAAYLQARNFYQLFGEAFELEINLTLDERLILWSIPWELLHDGILSQEDNAPTLGFLGLSTPIYRRVKMKTAPEQITQSITKALIIAADPRGNLTELDAELTWLQGEMTKHKISVDVLKPDEELIDDPAEVLNQLINGRYQLLHFIGHGQFSLADPADSGLLLGRKGVDGKQLSATILAQAAKESSLTMVFLSACFGAKDAAIDEDRPWEVAGIITGLLRAGVPAAVGLRWKVGDSACRQLAQAYYTNLFAEMSPEKALQRARLGLLANNKVDWANPVISKRRGVNFNSPTAPNV